LAEHVEPQLIPDGELVTVPVPVPVFTSVRAKLWIVNVAVADLAAFIVTTQLPVPVQAPLQPLKVDPAAAAAVSVTEVPLL
jgi:hypothetical protein